MAYVDPARRPAANPTTTKPTGRGALGGVIRERDARGELARAGFAYEEPDLKPMRFWAGLFVVSGVVGFLLALLWVLALIGAGPRPWPVALWTLAALSPLYWVRRLPRRMMWTREAVAFDSAGGVWFNAPGRRPGSPLELRKVERMDAAQIVNIEARHWPERRAARTTGDSYRDFAWGARSIEFDVRAIMETGEAVNLAVHQSEESARVIVRQLSLALAELRGGIGLSE